MLNQFLCLWCKTYLREHHSIKEKQQKNAVIAVGDVVVLNNDSSKRHFWKLAVVQQLLKGNDEVVRAAIIKVVDCEGRPSLLRSIQHLEVGTDETGMKQQKQPQAVTEASITTGDDASRPGEAPVSNDCENVFIIPHQHASKDSNGTKGSSYTNHHLKSDSETSITLHCHLC